MQYPRGPRVVARIETEGAGGNVQSRYSEVDPVVRPKEPKLKLW
jgi:hypothetical protein